VRITFEACEDISGGRDWVDDRPLLSSNSVYMLRLSGSASNTTMDGFTGRWESVIRHPL
jgi:hypothetical protein